MRKHRHLTFVVASIFLASLWGCGSSLDSGGDQTGPGTDLANATRQGSESCEVCHTAIVNQGWTDSFHDTVTEGCEGCHGGGQFHKGIGPIPYPAPGVDRCATCHETSSPGFLTRHLEDDPATKYDSNPLLSNPVIEGYTKVEDCLGCHSGQTPAALQWQHDPNSTEINKQWAKSGHAGKIASSTPDTATVWGHYNWDQVTGSGNRASCERCHTATGAKNFLTNPATYNSANNNFSHLTGWTAATGSGQNELLYCWGCHSDVATGVLRNPGAITETYPAPSSAGTGTSGTNVTVIYPDLGPSNVCMACHLGREVGANITNTTDGVGTNAGDTAGMLSFINSHYLTAGATIFNESGYEYAGQTYDQGYHKQIGVGDTAGTGTAGPCVTCHMSGAESHSFEVVTKDATGTITAVASTACSKCHGNMTPAVLEAKKAEFHEAMEALRVALEAKGIYFGEAHPYFYTAPYVAGGTNTAFTNWAGPYGEAGWKNVMGAAFNYNLFEHDPGAYAHNRTYALSLIRDSIDFLGDGLVDGDSSIVRTMVRAGFDMGTVDSSTNPLHTAAIASAGASPSTGAATCSACHKASAHYGGNATSTGSTPAQWVAPYVNVYPACSTCHAGGSVSANSALLDQYATSNHGDVNGAWNHVSTTAPNVTTIAAVDYRTFCHRCHTTQGFIDHTAYSVSNLPAEFPLWPTTAGQTMLDAVACDACHTSVGAGTAPTRVLGAYTASYYSGPNATTTQYFNAAATFDYPDSGPSSICIRCHSGRDSSGIGQLIKDGTPTTGVAVLRTHYLGSALTLFNAGGYHFGTTDYTLYGSHKGIGFGGNGPCVSCHLGSTANHTFWPIDEDEATGTITGIRNADICAACHGANMTAAYLQSVRTDFKTVKAALEAALEAKGIFYRNEQETAGNTGRFYTSAAHATELQYSATTPSYLSLAGGAGNEAFAKDLMGAAFNLGFMDYIQEPGAYVHNWDYARKLLIDSIDVLDDGLVNGTNIPANVAAIDAKY